MLTRLSGRLLLRPEDVPPSRDDFEVVGAFNPGAVAVGREVVLLVRVAERPRERRPGFTALPRWIPGRGPAAEWVPDAELELIDPRVVRRRADGLVRLTFLSHLRVVRCGDGPGLDDRLPHLRPPRHHLLPGEQGRCPLPAAGRRRVRGLAPAQRGDAVHAPGDVAGAFPRPDPLGAA